MIHLIRVVGKKFAVSRKSSLHRLDSSPESKAFLNNLCNDRNSSHVTIREKDVLEVHRSSWSKNPVCQSKSGDNSSFIFFFLSSFSLFDFNYLVTVILCNSLYDIILLEMYSTRGTSKAFQHTLKNEETLDKIFRRKRTEQSEIHREI